MRHDPLNLTDRLRPTVEGMGYELVGVLYLSQGRAATVRVYIDSAEGIDVDDCGRVSHQVEGILDVEDPISGAYTLEVSSPGLDRPLFTLAHFQRFLSHRVKLKSMRAVAGRRNFAGLLTEVDEHQVTLEVDGELWQIALDDIDSARLVPEL